MCIQTEFLRSHLSISHRKHNKCQATLMELPLHCQQLLELRCRHLASRSQLCETRSLLKQYIENNVWWG